MLNTLEGFKFMAAERLGAPLDLVRNRGLGFQILQDCKIQAAVLQEAIAATALVYVCSL